MKLKEPHKEIQEILDRYANDQATTPDEYAILQSWLDSFPDKTAPILTRAEKDRIYSRIVASLKNDETFTGNKPVKERASVIHQSLKIAATILAVTVMSYLLYTYWLPERATEYRNDGVAGNVKRVILPDNSIVWLKGNSRLSFIHDPRQVVLSGEALFEVTADTNHPFSIQCELGKIEVLGTSFNVNSHDSRLDLQVLTGQVSISSLEGTSIVVHPEEAAYCYAGQRAIERHKLDSVTRSGVIQGTTYDMSFDDSRVSEVFERMEEKFDVRIEGYHDLRDCKVTADLSGYSLDTSLQLLAQALNFAYGYSEKRVIITPGQFAPCR